MELTELETRLLNNIARDEHTARNGHPPTCSGDVHVWLWADQRADDLGISEQAVGGVLTSLQAKKLIGVQAPTVKMGANPDLQRLNGGDPDGSVWFTDAGFRAWKSSHPNP
jgi:hypothetical protein